MISAPFQSRPAILDITWELLPDDYVLPDDPVENILQPALAAFLNEILGLHGFIQPNAIVATDFGICATVNGKTVVKAPDWVWIPNAEPPKNKRIRRSYTPRAEGDLPAIVMEFLSESECGEYSMNSNYPYGKWWFYERILKVPVYIIFNPEVGELEVYTLKDSRYEREQPTDKGLYWLDSLGLFIGVWQGERFGSTEFWLRWSDRVGELLPCGIEIIEQQQQLVEQQYQLVEQERQLVQQERELVEQERQLVQQERERNERLVSQLRSLGIAPDV